MRLSHSELSPRLTFLFGMENEQIKVDLEGKIDAHVAENASVRQR